jgi:dihydrofolate synthase/folylpolyglutamate synthase
VSTGGAPPDSLRELGPGAAWLESLIDLEKRPENPAARLGLDPVRRLLARVGEPQRGLSVVHVAGSKGKGSTALLAEAVLRALGARVGSFTSPHLERWTERFRLDGTEVAPERLASVLERLRPEVEAARAERPDDPPSFFDVATAAALLIFREEGVEHAVLEVGLGGRLDSTNVVEAAVACITTIELEHTRRLGSTRALIAREKAGILKPGRPAVLGALPPDALAVALARAAELGAPVSRLGVDFDASVLRADARGMELRLRDGGLTLELRLPVLGAHQASNAALALACVRRLGLVPDAELAGAARRGFATVELPARVELLSQRPAVVIDAAHTEDSARALARALALLPRRCTHLVLSVSADKNLGAILGALLPLADRVTVTRAEPSRSLAPAEVAAAVRAAAPELPLAAVPNPFLAVRAAHEGLSPDDLLCVTGSVYLAGIARRVLGPKAARASLPSV